MHLRYASCILAALNLDRKFWSVPEPKVLRRFQRTSSKERKFLFFCFFSDSPRTEELEQGLSYLLVKKKEQTKPEIECVRRRVGEEAERPVCIDLFTGVEDQEKRISSSKLNKVGKRKRGNKRQSSLDLENKSGSIHSSLSGPNVSVPNGLSVSPEYSIDNAARKISNEHLRILRVTGNENEETVSVGVRTFSQPADKFSHDQSSKARNYSFSLESSVNNHNKVQQESKSSLAVQNMSHVSHIVVDENDAMGCETIPLLDRNVSPEDESEDILNSENTAIRSTTGLTEVKSDSELVLSAKTVIHQSSCSSNLGSPRLPSQMSTGPMLHHSGFTDQNHHQNSLATGFCNKVFGQKNVVFAAATNPPNPTLRVSHVNKLLDIGGKSLDNSSLQSNHSPHQGGKGNVFSSKHQFRRAQSQDPGDPLILTSKESPSNNNTISCIASPPQPFLQQSSSVSRKPLLIRQRKCDAESDHEQEDTSSLSSADGRSLLTMSTLPPPSDFQTVEDVLLEEPLSISEERPNSTDDADSGKSLTATTEEDESISLLPIIPRRPKCFTMPLQRALTLPSSSDHRARSPMRRCPLGGGLDEGEAEDELRDTFIDIPIIAPVVMRSGSIDNNLMTIPTFTVTINPMEADEMTYVPESPSFDNPPKRMSLDNDPNSSEVQDGNGNSTTGGAANVPANTAGPGSHICPNDLDDEFRRSSIGSASSLLMEKSNLGIPKDLQIRRVSEISHINELRREVSGMEHLGSEYYEIRDVNPDAISLDTIHQTIFKRCQNKYMPPQRSSTQNKCFVIITTAFTILGIIYGFWYKNFGPGSGLEH